MKKPKPIAPIYKPGERFNFFQESKLIDEFKKLKPLLPSQVVKP